MCSPARLVWGVVVVVGYKTGLKGGGREKRWGSRVTRPDAEPTQNVVSYPPRQVAMSLLHVQMYFLETNLNSIKR